MGVRLQELEARLEIGSPGVRMVGIWGCGGSGIEVLKQKALITIVGGKFDMHDLIQEMGHNIVRGEHPNNPEKHSRVWKDEEIKNMFHGDATMENYKIEAIQYDGDPSLFLLELFKMENLRKTPDFGGLTCLRKLTLKECKRLTWIHPSLGNHPCLEDVSVSCCDRVGMLPTIVHMEKLKTLEIFQCDPRLEFPKIKSNMESLVKLTLNNMWIDVVLSSIGEGRFPNLISLHLSFCHSKNKEANYYGLEHLEEFTLKGIDYWRNAPSIGSWLIGKVVNIRERYRSEDYASEVYTSHSISMKPVISGLDSQDDVVWQESDGGKYTWVFYVSFATLRHTPWWNSNYKAISIHNTQRDLLRSSETTCTGSGVALVARESGSGPTKTISTKQEESEFSHYTPKFEISHDSEALQISFPNEDFDQIEYFLKNMYILRLHD
ncbi:hypothetical protein L1987_23012 [Smallanthus sonchifolius]|uniref:Uncharacterized protein n=1 Tax=Smallanthus sonchifolius TaxID=185202 RepID=A0ACB9IGE4_9ASTR|nr:hypothetical protein L1987_23012 [Smallanthus sonchifolius]